MIRITQNRIIVLNQVGLDISLSFFLFFYPCREYLKSTLVNERAILNPEPGAQISLIINTRAF